MNLDEYKNLDINNIGGWPWPAKVVVILVVCAVIGYATYHYDISEQQEELAAAEAREQELRQTFETKQKKAANLDALKQQMTEMEESFGDMLRQLPNQTEVAGLLVDISQTGLAAGLEFELFKPGDEIPSEFYAELPIEIRVVGDYHQFGEFVSGIAALPRIVTTHNVAISRGNDDELTMNAVAKTYRALEEEEIQDDKPKAKNRRRR
ncbi:type IV pilus assembly protein PilO [Methylohalomonas lacus]|uniref:Type IV pilus assembly protein PilO n=1 Tax=Methylohalomonas lacus TaxID=398773 RepID=A0AAE3HMZ3_9GAMM|nr:type 4a pilus biogenesis protein PilO [Methylohalomonas lacus]MCS3904139.1 type IV pilus assembly protein PilO [Methylohalomonas lacus]